ncbi:hypothetical protein H112_08193 [Trichophyton rubrum D6]|uniref:Uncharacterized protein n=3 Tax=Trichophyton TaxID=5550 RepID=A0A080WK63_TRIRC|nr:uncharacterized protein TERG_11624 [Trichophyton rubrum CBS 118892]EZF10539.1 hypothetical protein H100_08221 [Trichophyton rubrum MR850]EZF37409.1 hypothetical protein H102_08178 [Trichophyton rubrum CBS 100081]EZF48106.1 hypothetical protein H103_08203 [Trichophyton rubrum CBS 288.86]EZF58704.1 hypothetical protein H104_08154 [Trichophyton rubrum CBS 289.86]EZF69363.1 hypothetical protein H105_08206 [Trichophyton soudanense CBS 452.61]EZF79986.1 hypothetical protein H110_08200 [Trichophy
MTIGWGRFDDGDADASPSVPSITFTYMRLLRTRIRHASILLLPSSPPLNHHIFLHLLHTQQKGVLIDFNSLHSSHLLCSTGSTSQKYLPLHLSSTPSPCCVGHMQSCSCAGQMGTHPEESAEHVFSALPGTMD